MSQTIENAQSTIVAPSGSYQSVAGIMKRVYIPPMGSGTWKYNLFLASSKRCDVCCNACCYGQFVIFGKIGNMLGHFDHGLGIAENIAAAEVGGIAGNALSGAGGAPGVAGDVGAIASRGYMIQTGMDSRQEVRIRSGIPGNRCDDCCAVCCCMPCALTQMYLQLAECPVDGGRTEDNRPVIAQPPAVGMKIPTTEMSVIKKNLPAPSSEIVSDKY